MCTYVNISIIYYMLSTSFPIYTYTYICMHSLIVFSSNGASISFLILCTFYIFTFSSPHIFLLPLLFFVCSLYYYNFFVFFFWVLFSALFHILSDNSCCCWFVRLSLVGTVSQLHLCGCHLWFCSQRCICIHTNIY